MTASDVVYGLGSHMHSEAYCCCW